MFLAVSACSAGSVAADAPRAAVHPDAWPRVQWPLKPDPRIEHRVKDLLAKMSLRDKVGQLIQADVNSVTPEDVRRYRLGSILAGGGSGPGGKPFADAAAWKALADAFHAAATDSHGGAPGIPLLFGIDAVHGNNNVVGATLFPHNVALGATRDPALIRRIGAATAQEVRAAGMNWAFAPTLAVPRDNRWGRSYEGYSENPALVARYAGAMVEGLQGVPGTPQFLDADHVIASAKHFVGDGSTEGGKDQGDARISEAALRDIAAAGYPPAIRAGVQTVMASFSSWNGVKMHADKGLLTDVLKGRMDFGGFVVGDWNAHGQIPGCSNEDCPTAINAGIDMLMAPDSWRGLYAHTLAEAQDGAIPESRLDDAVARILRVKLRMGLFDAPAPSQSPLARRHDVLGSPEHRALARRAVRESLVLLKNNGGVLPIDPRRHVLVAGDGADSLPRQAGGWTLTWQGTGTTRADFPGATSIWQGIRDQVRAAGGAATLSVDGRYRHKPDVAVVVFGETPYAEFQGDRPNLAYSPGDPHDLELLQRLRSAGIPVVSVFLSGRPLWVNPEINASDAFVAAWLPGSEGEGVADVLLRKADGSVQYDFHGKLAYSWPRSAVQTPLNVGQPDYHPQFAYGYGLTYADRGTLAKLPETSGLDADAAPEGVYFDRGEPERGYALALVGADRRRTQAPAAPAASADESLRMRALDRARQEDARRFAWSRAGAFLELRAETPLDLRRQTNGDVLLTALMRVDALPAHDAWIGMDCDEGCRARLDVGTQLARLAHAGWLRVGVPLKCFRAAGADMGRIDVPFALGGGTGNVVAVARVAIGTDVDRTLDCPAR